MRRLPVYLLLDTSGSMRGEPIEAVRSGVEMLVGMLRQDPYALETVWLSIITFDREVNIALPLTSLESAVVPEIKAPESSPTHLGEALKVLCGEVQRDVIRNSEGSKGDWRPLLFIMTDGAPSDRAQFTQSIVDVKGLGFGLIVGCAAGPKASVDAFFEFADHTVKLDSLDAGGLKSFFTWVSASVSRGSVSQGVTTGPELPPPPAELVLVV
ncbi:MAG: VWA domain-containing protein [Actinobacteria bacterium]|nr:VWA domain-containing protein [Actinomycetota bacterium]